MKKYRVFTTEFKQQVLAEIEAGKSMAQAAREHQLSPGLIGQWRNKARNGQAFVDRLTAREKQLEKQLAATERKLAQLVVENDLLKKLQEDISRRTKRSSGLLSTGRAWARKEEPVK